MNFLWPSKPEQIQNPDKFIELWDSMGTLKNWGVQLKKNGCRCLPHIKPGSTILFDRHGKTLTMGLEKDWSILREIFKNETLLDGELIGRKQGEVSNRLYLWDLPYWNGLANMNMSYKTRYEMLRNIFFEFAMAKNYDVFQTPEWEYIEFPAITYKITVGVAKTWPAQDWRKLIAAVKYNGSKGENEGLVFKDLTHDMSWSIIKTREIKGQLKFLLKYWDGK
jgi:hypothetical protein